MLSKFGTISESIDEELIEHIKSSTFYMKHPQISQCIDGRRTPNESNLGMSIPGGGIGHIAIILAVLEETVISQQKGFREEALDVFFDVIGGKENLSYHTDDHHCNKGEIGCGHIALLLQKDARKKYGLSDESTEYIKSVMEIQQETAIYNILKGEHKEIGIIKSFSSHHSVHANYNGKQFFVYTPKIAYTVNKEIGRKLYNHFVRETSLSITAESLAEMLQQKMNLSFYHTVHTLAPDLPVYRVRHSLNGNIRHLKKIANISTAINTSYKDMYML